MSTIPSAWVTRRLSRARRVFWEYVLGFLYIALVSAALLAFAFIPLVIIVGLFYSIIGGSIPAILAGVVIAAAMLFFLLFLGVGTGEIIAEWWWEPRPPDTRLMSVTNFFYSSIEIERIFKPIMADWCEEYSRAYEAGQMGQTIVIGFVYRYRFAQTMLISMVYKFTYALFQILKSAIKMG